MSKLKIDQVTEFLDIFSKVTISDVPVDAFAIPSPSWVGRVLFRQITALFTRKDHGPNRGIANKGRMALLKAAIQFAKGAGNIPKLNVWISDTTFEDIELKRSDLDVESNELLKRYYLIKLESLQFFGASNFGIPFWEGLNILLLTYPIIIWTSLAQNSQDPMADRIQRAISLVDDHFGFNKILGGLRQRYGFNLLAQRNETEKLIAWYSRQAL
jgi:lysine-N-methylase